MVDADDLKPKMGSDKYSPSAQKEIGSSWSPRAKGPVSANKRLNSDPLFRLGRDIDLAVGAGLNSVGLGKKK